MKDLIGKHVTVIAPISNIPVTPENVIDCFSGFVESIGAMGFSDASIRLKLRDGTMGTFFIHNLVGLLENKAEECE